MPITELLWNIVLMLLCYVYVIIVILVSGRFEKMARVSRKTSRKSLHIMIGNLPFVIPFFTVGFFPGLVATPFIFLTLLASPYSPFKGATARIKGLSDITEEGHHLGLVFYAVSYTCLAFLFPSRAYVIAAGILPMAYGDAAASIVGEKLGKRKYKLVARKSLEGSAAMFLVSFASLAVGLVFFSFFYPFSLVEKLVAALAAAGVATFVEGFSPMGFDNITVPVFSVLVFLLYSGGA
jgi:dolichol kinase